MRDTEDLLHDAWLYDTQTDEEWYEDDTPQYRDPFTNQLLDLPDCETYTVFVLADWTNKVLDVAHDVPLHGVPYFVDHAKFLAWDHPGGPITCEVYMIPTARMPERTDRITTQMMRYARFVDRYTAQADGAPSPLEIVTELHTA